MVYCFKGISRLQRLQANKQVTKIKLLFIFLFIFKIFFFFFILYFSLLKNPTLLIHTLSASFACFFRFFSLPQKNKYIHLFFPKSHIQKPSLRLIIGASLCWFDHFVISWISNCRFSYFSKSSSFFLPKRIIL